MQLKKEKNIASSIKNLIEPVAKNLNFEIWDVRFLKEGSNWYLRIFIDKPTGVTIEDCETFSRIVDKSIDDLNLIEVSYCLEVCSPGIERELINEEHFEKFINNKIMVKLIRPNNEGKRDFKGVLKGYENGSVIIEADDCKKIVINKKDTVWVKLDDFNSNNELED